MTALLVCPVCEEAGEEPCEDVIAQGVLAVEYWMPGFIAEVFASGVPADPDVTVPLLVAQPAWSDVLIVARDHDGSGCDPIECDDCVSQRSVMQVNCCYWRTLERAAT